MYCSVLLFKNGVEDILIRQQFVYRSVLLLLGIRE